MKNYKRIIKICDERNGTYESMDDLKYMLRSIAGKTDRTIEKYIKEMYELGLLSDAIAPHKGFFISSGTIARKIITQQKYNKSEDTHGAKRNN